MNELEDLKIYQNIVELLFYTYSITIKFPNYEKNGLVSDIKNHSTKLLEEVIKAQREYNVSNRIMFLNQADSELKVIKVLVRISYKYKYINSRNYGSWSRKLANVANPLIGWIKKCQRQ